MAISDLGIDVDIIIDRAEPTQLTWLSLCTFTSKSACMITMMQSTTRFAQLSAKHHLGLCLCGDNLCLAMQDDPTAAAAALEAADPKNKQRRPRKSGAAAQPLTPLAPGTDFGSGHRKLALPWCIGREFIWCSLCMWLPGQARQDECYSLRLYFGISNLRISTLAIILMLEAVVSRWDQCLEHLPGGQAANRIHDRASMLGPDAEYHPVESRSSYPKHGSHGEV